MVFFLYGGLWGLFKGIVYLLLNICSVFLYDLLVWVFVFIVFVWLGIVSVV